MKSTLFFALILGIFAGGLLGLFLENGYIGVGFGMMISIGFCVMNTFEFVPSLPQIDPESANRQTKLAEEQKEYQYSFDFNGLSCIKKLPLKEYPTPEWGVKAGLEMLQLIHNNMHVYHSEGGEQYKKVDSDQKLSENEIKKIHRSAKEVFEKIMGSKRPEQIKEIFDDLVNHLYSLHRYPGKLDLSKWYLEKPSFLHFPVFKKSEEVPSISASSLDPELEKGLDIYRNIFQTVPLPKVAKQNDFLTDSFFAQMRTAGPNPVVIECVSEKRFNELNHFVTEKDFRALPFFEKDSLESAIKDGRVFICDYKALLDAKPGQFSEKQKFVYAPLALFAIPNQGPERGNLCPVAIQCRKNKQADALFFPPKEGKDWKWEMAKTIVQIADGNYHELISHLGHTHLVTEPFIIATHRHFPKRHPLSILLRPHFEGTLFINEMATKKLIAPGGSIEKLLSETIRSSQELASESVIHYSFENSALPKALEIRGFDSQERKLDYPYREDALKIWNAIEEWVSDYIDIYYPSQEDIKNDIELANWVAELISEKGGRVKDFGEQGKIKTKEYLQKALTQIIFTASAQHAAVNFPQNEIMSFAPALPLSGYQAPPALDQEVSSADWLKLLPPANVAITQFALGYALGSIYYTQLGKYAFGHFTDRRIFPILEKFQSKLSQIEKEIIARNKKRTPYEFLLPSKIPQSINV